MSRYIIKTSDEDDDAEFEEWWRKFYQEQRMPFYLTSEKFCAKAAWDMAKLYYSSHPAEITKEDIEWASS